MTNELKPCPFCGDEAIVERRVGGFTDLYFYWVRCKSECVTTCNPETSEQEAIDRWNTRYKRTCHGIKNESEPKDQWVRCSECNCGLWWQDPATGEHVINFCPNCGAEVVDGE